MDKVVTELRETVEEKFQKILKQSHLSFIRVLK